MNEPGKRAALLLSLRPCFASLVFRGKKRAELRRRFAQDVCDWEVFVYVTSPVKQLQGGFRVESISRGTPDEVWNEVSVSSGLNRKQFDEYYQGRSMAYALKIVDVWEYVEPVTLSTLRDKFGDFVVPQSWRYVSREEYKSLCV